MTASLHLLDSVRGRDGTHAVLARGNVAATIDKIKRSYKARTFADLLIKDRDVAGLFLHNWRQYSLFPEFSLPVFADTDLPPAEHDPLALEARDAAGRSGVAFESILEAAQPLILEKVKALLDRMKADGIDPETVSQETLIAFFLRTTGVLSGTSPLAGVIDLVRPFEDYFADEMGDFAFELLSAIKSGTRASGASRTNRILEDSSLTPESYRAVVRRMERDGFLRTGLAIHWCEGHPDLPVSLFSVGDSSRVGMKCEVCKQLLVRSRFMLPTSECMLWIRHYHGVLQYLLPWTLEQHEIRWAANVYLKGSNSDREKDLIFRRSESSGLTIVECKSDYTDSPERTVHQKLRDHLVQLSKSAASYSELGIDVEGVVLATNYEVTPERQSSIERWIAEDSDLEALRNLHCKAVGPGNLDNWWTS